MADIDKLCEELKAAAERMYGRFPVTQAELIAILIDDRDRLRDRLGSCASLLETMAESAEEEGREVDAVMMSVMAKDARAALGDAE